MQKRVKDILLLFVLVILLSLISIPFVYGTETEKNSVISGKITSISLSKDGKGNYISGNIDVTEKIDGKSISLSGVPSIVLTFEDNSTKSISLTLVKTNVYSFKIYIDSFKKDQKVLFSIKMLDNIQVIESCPNKLLGLTDLGMPISCLLDEYSQAILHLGSSYEGIINASFDTKNLKVNTKGDYLYCTVSVYELFGTKKIYLNSPPKVTVIAPDGKRKNVTASLVSKGVYHFNYYLSNLASGITSFNIEISSSNKYNTSPKNKKTFKINTNSITGIYGKSYLGTNLTYRKLGNGPKVLFVVATQHGFEDAWKKDR